jgi:cell wall-associated NlpC family hydrolase
MRACLALLILAVLPLQAEPANNYVSPLEQKASAKKGAEKAKRNPAGDIPSVAKKSQTGGKKPKADGRLTPPAKTPAPTEGAAAGKKSPHGPPALIETTDLLDFDTLPDDRKKLIEGAIRVAKVSPWLPYKFGGSSPADGGFDCSGAMYFVMNKAGLKPPRTSADQFRWIKESKRLHETPGSSIDIDHESLATLKPGDLLFWEGTYAPTDGRTVNITHVAIYLGREKKDKRPVMINATDGRSYRGKQANGYGVYDFQLPKEGSRARFAGYGTPPGIAEVK